MSTMLIIVLIVLLFGEKQEVILDIVGGDEIRNESTDDLTSISTARGRIMKPSIQSVLCVRSAPGIWSRPHYSRNDRRWPRTLERPTPT